MIKQDKRDSNHPDWKSLKQLPLGLSLKELHEISK